MEDGVAAWPSLDYTDTIKSPHFDVPPDEGPILGSTVFSAIAFKTPPRGRLVDPYKEQLAYLRPVDQDLQQTPPAESLEDHPVALRTFASFPPIEAMHVDSPFDIVLMQNKRGLVAKDVCLYLCMHLEQKVYSDSLSESLRYLGQSASEAFPWDLPTLERSVKQLQDWFKVVRWMGLEYRRPVHNRWFVLMFEPRELPGSPRDVVGLCRPGPSEINSDENINSD